MAIEVYDDSRSHTIFESDTAGRQRVYLGHLERTGNGPEALLRAHATRSTLASWRRDPAFKEREEDARYKSAAKYQRKIAQAALKGDVKAAMYLAERLNPEEMGKQVNLTLDFEPPARLSRPSLTEIPVVDPTTVGVFRELEDDAAEGDPTAPQDPERQPDRPDDPVGDATAADRHAADGLDVVAQHDADAGLDHTHPLRQLDRGA